VDIGSGLVGEQPVERRSKILAVDKLGSDNHRLVVKGS
jgi:hypothetical protein